MSAQESEEKHCNNVLTKVDAEMVATAVSTIEEYIGELNEREQQWKAVKNEIMDLLTKLEKREKLDLGSLDKRADEIEKQVLEYLNWRNKIRANISTD
jgi:transcriptional regulator NrdR family protein